MMRIMCDEDDAHKNDEDDAHKNDEDDAKKVLHSSSILLRRNSFPSISTVSRTSITAAVNSALYI